MSNAPRRHASLTRQLLLMVAASFAFGFALIPLYDVLCEVAGLRVNEQPIAVREQGAAVARDVTLEFLSTLPPGAEWEIRPLATSISVQPGRLSEARFVIHNRSLTAVTGQAVPSVAPATTARYLQKTECFCFTPQTFRSDESREFVVRFIIDPDLPEQVDRMTLAYSMYTLPAPRLAAR